MLLARSITFLCYVSSEYNPKRKWTKHALLFIRKSYIIPKLVGYYQVDTRRKIVIKKWYPPFSLTTKSDGYNLGPNGSIPWWVKWMYYPPITFLFEGSPIPITYVFQGKNNGSKLIKPLNYKSNERSLNQAFTKKKGSWVVMHNCM